MRVLVIEDEFRLAENIATAFREGPGYAVDVCQDGEDALLHIETAAYDLVVLDLMIPKVPGHDVLQRMRRHDDATPVLILTAIAETQSTITLLNLGADDYMAKPFDLGELIARARALIRRGKGLRKTVLQVGNLALSLPEQIVSAGGKAVDLSPTEYRVLEYLMHHPRGVVSKRVLLEHLYDFTWEHHSNVIEVHISNLRRKLRNVTETTVLETLRGRGYRLATSDDDSL